MKNIQKINNNKINKKVIARKIQAHFEINHKNYITMSQIEKVLDLIPLTVSSFLKDGKEIFWSGMGSFLVQKRKATKRRNPQNGKEIKIPSKNVVKFKVFKTFDNKCIKSVRS